jgi:hypothetical protein
MIGKSWNRFSVKLMPKSDRFQQCACRFAQLTLAWQSETVRPTTNFGWAEMMRIVTVALLAGSTGFLLAAMGALAQTAPPGVRTAQASTPAITDASAQRRRPLRRVPIYRPDHWEPDVIPRYNPGPNAVRDCTATYVQEYRPSGTVITPRMNCYWRPG